MKKLTLVLLTVLALNILAFGQDNKTKDKDYYKYNWNLTDAYVDWDAWQKDLDYVKSQTPKYLEYKGRLGESAQVLLEYQKFSEDISKISSKLYVFASLSQDVDSKNTMYVSKLQELQTVFIEMQKKTAWIQPELAKIPKDTVLKWMDNNKEFAVYRHDFDSFYRQLSHILDEQTQKIVTYFSRALGAASNIYGSLATADMEFNKVTLSDGKEIVASPANASRTFAMNKNQGDRKLVAEAMAKAYSKDKNTYAEIWMGVAQNRWANAQLEGYKSVLESVLESNNISEDVYTNLIDVASHNTASLLKYRELRKKALGLDKYYGSDEALELVDFEKTYSYDEAVELVKKCLVPMGKEYNELLDGALKGGWIDVNEKPGKRGGAYSWSIYGVHPYILLNWNGTRDYVYTLAHELGHSMHSMLSSKYQPYVYADYASVVAETASTFNEKMLLDYMIKNTKDPKEKIALLVQAIDNISGTFYRQAQFAEFEYDLYSKIEKDEPLNADIMANLYMEIDKKYNGEIMERSDDYANSWPRVHHFYNYTYYVYNYAVSFSASSSLFNQIAKAKTPEAAKKAQERYLTLLKSGGSDYPYELLKKAGVDFSTKAPFEAVVKRMDDLVNQLEVALKKAGKI